MADNFSTLSTDEKNAYLGVLERARLDLVGGARVAKGTYSQGGNVKSIEYAQSDMASLMAIMMELRKSLGLSCGRRAIGIRR